MMSDAMAVIRAGLGDAWADLWTVLACNLIWLLSVLLILPGPPATIALFYYANRLAHGEVADIADFWQGIRRYWSASYRWGLINAFLIILLVGDLILTGRLSQSAAAHLIQGLYLAILGVWSIIQLYALPFLFEQETPSVRQALRNGAVMLGKNIGFSLVFSILLTCLLLIGTFLFMLSFAFGGFLIASSSNYAVINHLDAQRFGVQEK